MYKFLICFFLISSNLLSNNKKLETFFNATKNQDYDNAYLIACNIEDDILKGHLITLVNLLTEKTPKTDNSVSTEPSENKELNFVKFLISAYQNNYAIKQDNLQAFKNFSSALKIAESLENEVLAKAALIGTLDLFAAEIFIGSSQFEPFLERLIELRNDTTDDFLILLYQLIFLTKADDDILEVDAQYYSYYGKLDSIFLRLKKTHPLYPKYYFEKGIYHKIEKDYGKAEDFFLKADSIASKNKYFNVLRGKVAWQLSSIHMENNQIEKAKRYLKIFKNSSHTLRDLFYSTRLESLIFQKEGIYDSAYFYLRKSVDVEYQLGYKNNTLESSILTVQNQTDKLKLDKLELDAQNKKIKIWTLALGLALLFGSVIGVLTYKNTKRKQLLAEQGKILEEQKVATLLKDQELATIDAMIEGQEKERQRIAHDLHDDLGGLMANVKLHFNSLQEKSISNKQELYNKTNELLEEAYQKIRAIAHEKNSGVIAKQGLLRAVNQMAEKISQSNRIGVTVQDFGLDNRLENSLEINLFRIIQELITNIIKHAKATMANIHLTNHGDVLNILVEDNGIGFDPKTIKKGKDGMGLKSIDKRISHLEGTFHIESEPGKGSTIIIDIPI